MEVVGSGEAAGMTQPLVSLSKYINMPQTFRGLFLVVGEGICNQVKREAGKKWEVWLGTKGAKGNAQLLSRQACIQVHR